MLKLLLKNFINIMCFKAVYNFNLNLIFICPLK